MSSVGRVRIVLNLLVSMVNRRGQISLQDAARMFDLDEASLAEVVKVLVDKGVLVIEYSAEGEKVIKKGTLIESTIYHKEIKDKVDSVLDDVKVDNMESARKAESLLGQKPRRQAVDGEDSS